jgi:RNA polymerase sigma-70 factor (ECF subfamily)
MRNSLGGGETHVGAASLDAASLEELALGVHGRLDGAFERMVERFEKPLFNYAQRLLQNALDAQEVVQDTFLRAHRALTVQYSSERCRALALKPWLFRITRNLCANKRRGRRQELERPMTDALANGETTGRTYFPDWQVPFLCRIEHREELERLDRAIARLPLESRELVALRFIEEMSYAEIASTTGQTEASLRGKVFRALRQLRDVLSAPGGGGAGDLPAQETSHAM